MLSDFEAEHEERREGVCELQDADGCDERGKVRELRDGGGDDEGDAPVDRDNGNPEELTPLLGQRREVEDIREKVVVKDLDTDVSVESRRNQGGNKGNDVTCRLPSIRRYALIRGVDGELALEGVDIEPKHDIEEEDEKLGAKHAFPEIPRTFHLGHEFAEKHGTTIGIDRLHQSNNLLLEWRTRG